VGETGAAGVGAAQGPGGSLVRIVALPAALFLLAAVLLMLGYQVIGLAENIVSVGLALAGASFLGVVAWRSGASMRAIVVAVVVVVVCALLAVLIVRVVSGWGSLPQVRQERALADARALAADQGFTAYVRESEALRGTGGWPVAEQPEGRVAIVYEDGVLLLQERADAVLTGEQLDDLVAPGRSLMPGTGVPIPEAAQAQPFAAAGEPAVVLSWRDDQGDQAFAVAQQGTTLVRLYGDDAAVLVEAARGLVPAP
jgi:hypothetical protein